MSPIDADVAVVGVGTVGSLALAALAERGVAAVGLERHRIGHRYGGAGGESRMLRIEHGPLAPPVAASMEAVERWRLLEERTSRPILRMCSGLWIGDRDGDFLDPILAGMRAHDLPHRVYGAEELAGVYPQHRLGPDEIAVHDPHAGYLLTEGAVVAATAYARERGAVVHEEVDVDRIDTAGRRLVVGAGAREWRVERVLVTAGAWTAGLLPDLAGLRVERLMLAWTAIDDPARYRPERFPVFIRRAPGVDFTGWPTLDDLSIKVSRFAAVSTPGSADEEPDPERDRRATAELTEAVRRHLRGDFGPLRTQFLPDAFTEDGLPVVDRAPGRPGVVTVTGLSGKGFKLAPLLAEEAVELLLADAEPAPVEEPAPRLGRRLGSRPGA